MMSGSAQAASYRALSYHACYSMQREMGKKRGNALTLLVPDDGFQHIIED